MKSLAKLVFVMMMALTLLGSTTVAFAQDFTDRARPGVGIRGEVTASGDGNLTVTNHNGQSVTVNILDNTKIRLVAEQREGSPSDINVGKFVGVHGLRNDNGLINARVILVLPENPRDWARAGGKVTALEGDVIVVEKRDGDSQRITTDADTKFRIGKKQGNLADINVDDPVAAAGLKQSDGSFLAKLVIVATPRQIRNHTLRGEVLSVDSGTATLTVKNRRNDEGTVWTVKTTDSTNYRIQGVENPTLDDIEVGNHVLVLGKRDDEDSHSGTARAIAVIPERHHDRARVQGQVTDIDGTAFTIHNDRGDFTVLTDASTTYRARGDQAVSFDDIKKGGRVVVVGTWPEDKDNTIQAKTVGIAQRDRD